MVIENTDSKAEDAKVSEKLSYYEAVGRRKESSARVRLYVVQDSPITVLGLSLNKGDMVINKKPIEKYFVGEVAKKMYLEPYRTTNTLNRFVMTASARGGGMQGQLAALIHGISRALEKVDKEKFRPILKKRGFMTRDPRAKQRRKAGYAGKARARKQSPKR